MDSVTPPPTVVAILELNSAEYVLAFAINLEMWNDNDIPLAVFFTFRSYGTWLHGDERGSVDRHHNVYGTPRIAQNTNWKNFNETLLKRPPLVLNAEQRKSVEKAIRETCDKRRWELFAFNIRTNHVHLVVDIRAKDPKQALGALKANATRQMREDRVWDDEDTPWAEKGSKRRLWNLKSLGEAIDYVINRQGDDLPDYDWW